MPPPSTISLYIVLDPVVVTTFALAATAFCNGVLRRSDISTRAFLWLTRFTLAAALSLTPCCDGLGVATELPLVTRVSVVVTTITPAAAFGCCYGVLHCCSRFGDGDDKGYTTRLSTRDLCNVHMDAYDPKSRWSTPE
ncbi:hypothetical protein F5146DRAFT_1145758 [Armillaria mellea]|nr:hypothetical protein F5146DRAFT_1145758 [Armillaria mellea]